MAKANIQVVKENANLPVPAQFLEDSGAGFEQVTAKDQITPFIRIVHGLSPQVKPGSAKYNKEARIGNFVDTSLNKLYDSEEGILFIPVAMTKRFVLWPDPRQDGAFPLGQFNESDEIVATWPRDGLKFVAQDGKIMQQTYMWYGLFIDGDVVRPAVMALTGASIKIAKQWVTLANSKQSGGKVFPMYSHVYRLTTFIDKNQKGQDFPNWKVSEERMLDPSNAGDMALYTTGKTFNKQVVAGSVKVDERELGETSEAGGVDTTEAAKVI